MLRYRIPTLWTVFLLLVICVSRGGVWARAAELRPVSSETSFERSLLPSVMDRIYHNRLEAESSLWLAVYLFNVPVDHSRADDATRFTITSHDDPAYAADRSVHPVRTGSRTRAIRVLQRQHLLVKQTVIFLELPTPMKRGCTYSVQIGDLGTEVPQLESVLFDDTRLINDNIRLNQLGYLPGYDKIAYLGQYMGSAGPMSFAAETFELVDREGNTAFTGSVTPRGMGDDLVGQTVYDLNFSTFDKPGTYRIRVAGVGLSPSFEIGPRAMNPLYLNYMRGHYHQRCGMAIDGAYSRHHRPACHLDDAYLEERVESLKFIQPKQPPLHKTGYDDKRHQAIHGHHDAGDYGKYTISGSHYVFAVLNAMDVFPKRFLEDNLGLPYSGNGVPDLLEEVKWELDWLENMQDPADGGVFGVIKPSTGGYEQHMPLVEARRLFYPKDTVFTAAYAAALARAARSPMLGKHYPDAPGRYLAKAKAAWEFLENNDRYVQYFHYGAIFGDKDELNWAAAELYAATGVPKYHQYLLEHFDPAERRWGWWPLVEGVGNATMTYTFMQGRQRDEAMLERCRSAIRDACRMHVEDAAAYPYRLSMPRPSISHGSYGWYFPGDLAGYNLLMGYALDGDRKLLQAALSNLDYICGANPSGYFLQTGLGAKRNIEVVDQESVYDRIIEPVPGLPLGIGSAGFYWLNQYGRSVGEGIYPDEWPLMNRWYDGFNVNSEFTMGPMMRETVVAAYFADIAPQPHPQPKVAIKADALQGPAPHTVQFRLDAATVDGEIRQVFWDFGDETFSTDPSPRHVFSDPGRRYDVAVTIIDAHGALAYDVVQVKCPMEKVPFTRSAHQPDNRTVALFHFDGNLKSARGDLELEVHTTRHGERAAYTFSTDAPMWMAKPTGNCLVLDGAEHFSVQISGQALPRPATTPMTLEMLLYLEEFTAWGYRGNPTLLGLRNHKSLLMGWIQDTWDKANAPKFGEVPSQRFADEFPRRRWCHVQIVYDGKGHATILVDGTAWGTSEVALSAEYEPVTLLFGPFRGRVDEVRLRLDTP